MLGPPKTKSTLQALSRPLSRVAVAVSVPTLPSLLVTQMPLRPLSLPYLYLYDKIL